VIHLLAFTVPLFDFEVPIEVVTLGLITGLTYGVLGLGLTLVYRTTRILNFAHGEIGALPAVLIPILVVNNGWPYWVVLPLALALAAALGGLTELLVIRRLSKAPRLILLVATIGVAQILLVINIVIPRTGDFARAPFPTPFHWGFHVGGYFVSPGQVVILCISPLVLLALSAFLGRTNVGMASRAAAENSEAAELAGVPVRRISLLVWTVAGLLAGVSAILVGPTKPLLTTVALGPSLMLRALAAAMIGGLVSLPMVFAGGVALGVMEALVTFNYPTGGSLELVLFLVIVGSLMARRGLGQLARGGEQSSWSLAGAVRSLPPRLARRADVRGARMGVLVACLLVAVLVPLPFGSAQHVLMTSVVLFALMGLSLVVLTGFAGQVSLGQFAFVGLGAVVGGRMLQLGYAPGMAMLYSVVAGGVAALVIGIPALRIRGLYLAVTTLGFAVATSTWVFGQGWLVSLSGSRASTTIPRPVFFGIEMQRTRNYYWFCLGVLALVAFLVHRLRATGIGRAMIAVRDNEPAAATLSIPPRRVKLIAFVLAGMIASLGGYLYGGLLVTFSSGNFGPVESLNLLAMVIFGGVTSITGAVLGAMWVRGIPYFFGSNIGLISSGMGLLVVLLVLPGGLAAVVFKLRDRLVTMLTGEAVDRVSAAAGVERPRLEPRVLDEQPRSEAAALDAQSIIVRYGGVVAVDDVSLTVARGEVVGLVGPNGAGKTTFFDVLSGQLAADAGQVLLDGEDISWLRPEQRALLGISRTFQQARLFDELTVVEAFELALEREEPSEVVPSLLGLPPSRAAERRKQLRADELVELLGLGPFAHRSVVQLSTGTRRLAELGCTIAMGAEILLLDEPTAGIAQREVEAFVPAIGEIQAHLGASMVIIDHDIPMIGAIVDRLHVLATGKLIASGHPDDVRRDPNVVSAYLGTDDRAIRRSGHVAGRAGNGNTAGAPVRTRPLRADRLGKNAGDRS
jgi:ABC-type branched-subunit amino acid transport system ATPase component/ABC-type branched-subunit amino acid transport system permease subunit